MTNAAVRTPKLDEIGYWSEVKLDIIREYAKAYSTILAAQNKLPLYHAYIDAFAGAGVHRSKTTGAEVAGSPLIALNTQPPFRAYHFIDLNGDRVDNLRRLAGDRPDVHFYRGDCNDILLKEVFPKVRYNQFRRGLCLLDPYGLHLNWEVIRAAGGAGGIELFINFPIMDMNMNALWHNRNGVSPDQADRMTAFWGDDSWRQAAYRTVRTLFDDDEEKAGNGTIAAAFRERLRKVAGFKTVAEPLAMRNTKGAVVYYLFFASPKPVALNIVTDIFNKFRNRGLAG